MLHSLLIYQPINLRIFPKHGIDTLSHLKAWSAYSSLPHVKYRKAGRI